MPRSPVPSMKSVIRVLLVEGYELLRAGVRHALASSLDIEVVGEAADIDSGTELIQELLPDVLVFDPSRTDGLGLEFLEQCRAASPATKMLALSENGSWEGADRAIDAGFAGYIDKTVGLAELAPMIRSIVGSRTVISISASAKPGVRRLLDPARPISPQLHASPLSAREHEVLVCLASGLTNQEAADRLFLSVKTIETYRSRLARKLGVRSRADLFSYAQAQGYLEGSSCSPVTVPGVVVENPSFEPSIGA